MGPKVLIVEDEGSIAFNIEFALRREGFDTIVRSTCGDARNELREGRVDLAILDVGLPDGSGLELCREIRQSSDLPIIMLTARSDEIDRVLGLELGADDYVTKPFSPRELAARVKTVLRRSAGPRHPKGDRAPSGPFLIDEHRFTVSFRGNPLGLSKTEFRLLKVLLARPGWVFTREKLMELAWDSPEASLERTVDAHIKSIRAKLRASGGDPDLIVTHRGIGYSVDEHALRGDP